MDYLLKLYNRLYYNFLNLILLKRQLALSSSLEGNKNLFLYFDYEREFGGGETEINNEDIIKILNLLEHFGFMSTWFTVGQIFEKYPESLKEIVDRGHEIGSHTYSHIAPLRTTKKKLRGDFRKFRLASYSIADIKGFHAPNNKWSFGMLKEMKKEGLLYDMERRVKGKNKRGVVKFISTEAKGLCRVYTIGDDWALYGRKVDKESSFFYFKALYSMLKAGEIGGIGFHPWVLFSDNAIYDGFRMFLEYLAGEYWLNINSAGYYIDEVLAHDK